MLLGGACLQHRRRRLQTRDKLVLDTLGEPSRAAQGPPTRAPAQVTDARGVAARLTPLREARASILRGWTSSTIMPPRTVPTSPPPACRRRPYTPMGGQPVWPSDGPSPYAMHGGPHGGFTPGAPRLGYSRTTHAGEPLHQRPDEHASSAEPPSRPLACSASDGGVPPASGGGGDSGDQYYTTAAGGNASARWDAEAPTHLPTASRGSISTCPPQARHSKCRRALPAFTGRGHYYPPPPAGWHDPPSPSTRRRRPRRWRRPRRRPAAVDANAHGQRVSPCDRVVTSSSAAVSTAVPAAVPAAVPTATLPSAVPAVLPSPTPSTAAHRTVHTGPGRPLRTSHRLAAGSGAGDSTQRVVELSEDEARAASVDGSRQALPAAAPLRHQRVAARGGIRAARGAARACSTRAPGTARDTKGRAALLAEGAPASREKTRPIVRV